VEQLEKLLQACNSELEIQSGINTNNKIKINAGYGVQTVPSFRFKKHHNAEAITSSGQLCVRGAGNYIEKKLKDTNFQVASIYEDTDSIFFKYMKQEQFLDNLYNKDPMDCSNQIIEWNKQYIQPLIDEYFDKLARTFNAVSNKIEMDFELIADKSTFFAPKKYIMRKMWEEGKYLKPSDNVFKFRGIEIVRTTTPQFFRNRLKEAIIIIFNNTNEALIDFINKTKKEYFNLPFIDMANPTGVNGMDTYNFRSKHIPLHVYGSLVYNHFIKTNDLESKYELIHDKAKIKVAYIKKPNCLASHVISIPNNHLPEEIEKVIKLDYEKMFEKNFMKPIDRFLTVINWARDRHYNLEDCF
jgi:DNA polymerase elongation subunit (family B)